MKNPVLSLLTLSCAALAVVPDWKDTLHAATGSYFVMSNASVTEQLKVSGCKPLKASATGKVVLNKGGSFEFTPDNADPAAVVTGTWDEVPGKSSNTFYMSVNRSGLTTLLSELSDDATANCGSSVDIMEPTTLFKKNSIVRKVKDNTAKGTVQLNAKQAGTNGAVSAKITITGTMSGPTDALP